MVNCKNCGAPLSLNDLKCPYCGTENAEAIEHIKKLKALEKGYNKARKEVSEEVQKSKKGYGPLIVLVILLLANLFLLPFHGASYEIADAINARDYSVEDMVARLDELLEKREYTEYHEFVDRYEFRYSDISDYYKLFSMVNYYVNIHEYMTDYFYNSEYYTDPLVKACENIKDFDDDYERTMKWIDVDKIKNHAEKLHDEYVLYLKTFLNFNDEDIESIRNLSKSELVVLAAKRLNNEE
ncbi:MAG: zinc ribbon domain-containing protein [Erysipelotrichaceae bacterium]|nr:zinc ribbon domain-containing protein [Erysipelotrichaceae bacterium]